MKYITDKILLLICCSALLIYSCSDVSFTLVFYLLAAISLELLAYYLNISCYNLLTLNQNLPYTIVVLFFLLLTFINPVFYFYIPLILYDMLFYENRGILLIPVISYFYNFNYTKPIFFISIVLLSLFSLLLHYKTNELFSLKKKLKETRDAGTELNIILNEKNRDLINRQNYEIHVATLKERNRIAREIHDNVGHMLSRSIIQLGALMITNNDRHLDTQFSDLKNSLNQAMDNIRTSVHDLHDDSIDLKNSISEILNSYSDYQISFDYDLSNTIPKEIKYCYISIVKEALTNITKHSNASKINIVMREHPSFFQFTIIDNGTNIKINSSGIGLENMEKRIESLGGTFSFNTEHGFCIFTSIPKTRKE